MHVSATEWQCQNTVLAKRGMHTKVCQGWATILQAHLQKVNIPLQELS